MFKNLYHVKSVNSGLIRLLEKFCINNNIRLPRETSLFNFNDRVPFSEWLSLLNYIEKNYSSPTLSFEIAQLVESEHLGILGYIGSCSDNLGSALQFLLKYHRLSYDFMDLSVKFNDNELVISWEFDPYFKAGKLADETMIAIFFKFVSSLIFPSTLKISKIEFTSQTPKDKNIYVDYFNCPVYFNQAKTNIYFPLSGLSLKITKADKTLNYFLIQQAEKLLLDLPENDSFEDLVRLEIIHSLNQGGISIENVAKRMGYSPRMFQYQLKQKGLNFKQSLNQVRKEMAVKYLSDLNLSILEISYLLSYQEQTSFIRAFKSWMGLSPLQYRRKNINNYSDTSLE
ncbi:AraC family transcriptional regulator ligand-binding domain-containing protein [Acinetobacter sp. ACIN00229]|uniref:AraC family transcriptional regulator n=1 Tax=Acinetobacter sp. ACIN00229 TaxID=2792607 RepID=UPI0018DF76B6|nr:AraC family transcriptional regulator [Acinetobacter sp. ACIN00229]MBI0424982.1 AraC family transcriptional regulator ligand-binding domain-containing protein [Acinetobacter sp. ACIN00229]